MARIDVVIPNWNGAPVLAPCLASLRHQTYSDFRVIVVDNGSIDDSRTIMSGHFPEVQVVALRTNTGFTGGVNRGIEAGAGEAVFLLNNDAEAAPGCLAALARALDEEPGFDFFACKVVKMAGQAVFDSAGDLIEETGHPVKRAYGEPDDGRYDRPVEVFAATGGAGLFRRRLFDRVGLFDERYFAYFEDADLAFRARRAGMRCLYWPHAVVSHREKWTSNKHFALTHFLRRRNRPLFIIEHLPTRLLLANAPRLLMEHLRMLAEVDPLLTLKIVFGFLGLAPGAVLKRFRLRAWAKVDDSLLEPLLARVPHTNRLFGAYRALFDRFWPAPGEPPAGPVV